MVRGLRGSCRMPASPDRCGACAGGSPGRPTAPWSTPRWLPRRPVRAAPIHPRLRPEPPGDRARRLRRAARPKDPRRRTARRWRPRRPAARRGGPRRWTARPVTSAAPGGAPVVAVGAASRVEAPSPPGRSHAIAPATAPPRSSTASTPARRRTGPRRLDSFGERCERRRPGGLGERGERHRPADLGGRHRARRHGLRAPRRDGPAPARAAQRAGGAAVPGGAASGSAAAPPDRARRPRRSPPRS